MTVFDPSRMSGVLFSLGTRPAGIAFLETLEDITLPVRLLVPSEVQIIFRSLNKSQEEKMGWLRSADSKSATEAVGKCWISRYLANRMSGIIKN
jgi:hypothetical protein